VREAEELAALVKAIGELDAATVSPILSRRPELARAEIAAGHSHTQTLLHWVIPGDGDRLTEAHLAIVRSLLDAGAEVNALGEGANNGRCTPITMAAWGGHAPVIRLLVSRGADPNGAPEQVARRHRPIDTAARHGHAEAVEALIEAGAVYSLDHLLMVGARGRLEPILAADSAAAARPLAGGSPPLHLALTSSQGAALLELLVTHGADLAARDQVGRTALHVAIENQNLEAARWLIERGAPVDLLAAAGMGDAERVASLLAEDPSRARAVQADGMTPLFYAAWAGDVPSTRRLLEAGAAVSPRARRLWACLTPLHAALQRGHREVAAVLLEHGADVNACGDERELYWPTPLHVAARWGTEADLLRLLEHGADPNAGSAAPDTLNSALAWGVMARKVELVRLLLERGLDLRHPRHREALHQAAQRGCSEMVRLLIENGADPGVSNGQGQTSLELARRSGHAEVVVLLEAHAD
jgi:ankyrin repeat protein